MSILTSHTNHLEIVLNNLETEIYIIILTIKEKIEEWLK